LKAKKGKDGETLEKVSQIDTVETERRQNFSRQVKDKAKIAYTEDQLWDLE
jgi:hypothetical protein